jgi:hypothetical protein
MGQDAVMIHPEAISAVNMASHPEVSLFAKTKRPMPEAFVIRCPSLQAFVIMLSNHAESLLRYIAAR